MNVLGFDSIRLLLIRGGAFVTVAVIHGAVSISLFIWSFNIEMKIEYGFASKTLWSEILRLVASLLMNPVALPLISQPSWFWMTSPNSPTPYVINSLVWAAVLTGGWFVITTWRARDRVEHHAPTSTNPDSTRGFRHHP